MPFLPLGPELLKHVIRIHQRSDKSVYFRIARLGNSRPGSYTLGGPTHSIQIESLLYDVTSFMEETNSKGPSTDPWGTTETAGNDGDVHP